MLIVLVRFGGVVSQVHRSQGGVMKVLKIGIYTMTFMVMIWFILSWMDVLAHNDPFNGDEKYNKLNMFTILCELK